ncbi:hypothetical protein M422DRAFT_250740 [Sphaerobolus stellatus SS14]|uniref:A-kinase anchor protein 7-like phosphoesterase domain-containing protein n=1 Tax=Sphaerobolus stellatus (strain SS14) TaxID=990650 RepID=A0A0C9W400_SPHS4|nr:hypothetical protein M422DRAFT_250740 [Sphaerobolus stellatus SS14]
MQQQGPHRPGATSSEQKDAPVSKKGNKTAKPPKAQLTHFLSLPIGHHEALREKWANISSALLKSTAPIQGLDESIILKPGSLHLTLGVLSLSSTKPPSSPEHVKIAEEAAIIEDTLNGSTPGPVDSLSSSGAPKHTIDDALNLLQSLQAPLENLLAGKGDLMVALERMDVMRNKPNQRPDQSHVMWAGPNLDNDEGRRLSQACDLIHSTFKNAGMLEDDRPLKLHCTLINTVYRKEKSKGRDKRKRGKKRTPFSFSDVLSSPVLAHLLLPEGIREEGQPVKIYLGSWSVNELQLCEMGSKDKDGVYKSIGAIPLR